MDAKLSVEVGAKIDELNQKMAQGAKVVSDFAASADNSLGKVDRSFKILNNTKFTFGANYESASRRLANEAARTGSILGGSFSKGAQSANAAVLELSRGIQDAPYGSMGYINNLQQFQQLFGQLVTQTGSFSGALKGLGSALMGPAGIGVAFSVVTAAITAYTMWEMRADKATKETTKSIEEQREEFIKTPYEKAYNDIAEMTRNIALAKQGLLDKTAVLKQYNTGLGQTIGQVNSLDYAEKALVKNGDAYLRLMFLKANAEFAFKKAAEENYNLSLKQDELESKKPQISKDFNINAERNKQVKETVINLRDLLSTTNQITPALDGVNTKVEQISKNLGEQLADESQLKNLAKTSDKAVDIAKNAQQAVIDFAKKNGFNLNGLFDIDATKNFRDVQFELRALMDVSGRVGIGLDGFVEQYNKTSEQIGKTPLIPFDKIQKDLKDGFQIIDTELIAFNDRAADIITNSLVGTFSGIGDAIGEALSGGQNVLEGLSHTLLAGLGGLLVNLGKLAIATGVGIQAIKTAFKTLNPLVAIGAGVALVALGTAINKSVSKLGDSKLPGFATGVDNFKGGLAVVGERGPEVVNLPQGAGVIPNHKSRGLLGDNAKGFIAETRVSLEELWIGLRKTEKRLNPSG